MDWKQEYQGKLHTAEEAVKGVRSGDRVYIGTASSIAYRLVDALYERRNELEDVVICQGLTSRPLPVFTPEASEHFPPLPTLLGLVSGWVSVTDRPPLPPST